MAVPDRPVEGPASAYPLPAREAGGRRFRDPGSAFRCGSPKVPRRQGHAGSGPSVADTRHRPDGRSARLGKGVRHPLGNGARALRGSARCAAGIGGRGLGRKAGFVPAPFGRKPDEGRRRVRIGVFTPGRLWFCRRRRNRVWREAFVPHAFEADRKIMACDLELSSSVGREAGGTANRRCGNSESNMPAMAQCYYHDFSFISRVCTLIAFINRQLVAARIFI